MAAGSPIVDTGSPSPRRLFRPRAQQRWVHSCCSLEKLRRALNDPDITAIESDILMSRGGALGIVPIMAHPPATTSDLSFKEFLDRCVNDGTRHIKLDFKELAAVEPCLQLLAAKWPKLHANGQGVWLNADVLPGPNARSRCPVPFEQFVPLCRSMCPAAPLSLGWRLGILGPDEAYSDVEITQMIRMCREHGLDGEALVFAASVRYFEIDPGPLVRLLCEMPASHLLLWTGSGEMAIRMSTVRNARALLKQRGLLDRVGFDVLIATSCMQVGTAKGVDCTFVSSRWLRLLFGCAGGTVRAPIGRTMSLGEAESLLTPGGIPAKSGASTPQRSSATGGGSASQPSSERRPLCDADAQACTPQPVPVVASASASS